MGAREVAAPTAQFLLTVGKRGRGPVPAAGAKVVAREHRSPHASGLDDPTVRLRVGENCLFNAIWEQNALLEVVHQPLGVDDDCGLRDHVAVVAPEDGGKMNAFSARRSVVNEHVSGGGGTFALQLGAELKLMRAKPKSRTTVSHYLN